MQFDSYYPISLNLAMQRCVVIGGGAVASRKVSGLLDSGADISIISPEINIELRKLVKNNLIKWTQSKYKSEYLAGAALVFGATDSTETNKRISQDAKDAGIPVNIADDPDNCTFILPAICKKDDIQIAVTTAGAAPAIAARIRDKIDSCIGREYETLVSILKKLRSRIRSIEREEKKIFWQRVVELEIGKYRDKKDELAELLTAWIEETKSTSKE